MTIEDKILAAFWSPTRGQHLPLVVSDVVNRARVKQVKAVPALRRLVNMGLINAIRENKGISFYEIAVPKTPWLAAQAGGLMCCTVRKPESLSAHLAGENEGGEE